MSINESLIKLEGVKILENDISGLNEVYRDIANEIGIENAVLTDKMSVFF